jgi:N6-adenosine-specific RNA methylase IME4
LALNVRDLINWGIDTGNMTADQFRYTVAHRQEIAQQLIDSGVSQRQAAKLLGVSEWTIRSDVRGNLAESARKPRTGSAATKRHRARVARIAAAKGVTDAPTNKYRIIYADPPWDYGAHAQPDYQTEQRDHYPVMPLDEICAIQIRDWVEDNAVLFLWVTSPILEKSFQVIRAWGFEYKASFVWDKIKHNMGHYNSVRHELLLICTRGSCHPDSQQLFDSVQSIERGKHSEKPAEFYDIIETLYTHGRKLEVFARRRRDGWDAWGHVAEISEASPPPSAEDIAAVVEQMPRVRDELDVRPQTKRAAAER